MDSLVIILVIALTTPDNLTNDPFIFKFIRCSIKIMTKVVSQLDQTLFGIVQVKVNILI